MTNQEIRAKLRAMLDDIAPSITITAERDDEDFEAMGYDSLDQSNLLLGIDETFGVKITDEEAEKLQSVAAYAAFIERAAAA